ncbi:hypothetical protein J7E96_02845 [Streptomyces sp. ISL-96]|uniref:hypothetical protein n=1 Tax=Streptomyces sp. ISL-96 TaxID=2819191 RepID=UPI001BEC0635|nr:hypothetical protein [Streptomyces sp. ISL-96]MBT2487492.1 hypothetical protein [Streptomyces sp. ISL-96]
MSIELAKFLTSWYGSPDTPSSPLPGECDWLPKPLKEWHRLSTQWSQPLMGVKRMLAPEEVKVEAGKAVFMEDSTGDWQWAFDAEKPSVVYDAEICEEWEPTTEGLPLFLVHSAVHEAIFNARELYWCTQVEENLLAEILEPLTEVAFGEWRWPAPGYRIFMNENILADVAPAGGRAAREKRLGYVQVKVASIDPVYLAYLDDISTVAWRKSSS